MSWSDNRFPPLMIERVVRKRLLLADGTWFAVAATIALACGLIGDQLFRRAPLGLHYQSIAQRTLAETESRPDDSPSINIVSIDEVDSLFANPNVIAIDARPRVFYELGHLPGAKSLPREEFDKEFTALEPDLRAPERTLLIYCSDASCEDGALVARALQRRGIGSLRLFHGGFAEWEAAGRTVEISP